MTPFLLSAQRLVLILAPCLLAACAAFQDPPPVSTLAPVDTLVHWDQLVARDCELEAHGENFSDEYDCALFVTADGQWRLSAERDGDPLYDLIGRPGRLTAISYARGLLHQRGDKAPSPFHQRYGFEPAALRDVFNVGIRDGAFQPGWVVRQLTANGLPRVADASIAGRAWVVEYDDWTRRGDLWTPGEARLTADDDTRWFEFEIGEFGDPVDDPAVMLTPAVPYQLIRGDLSTMDQLLRPNDR